MQQMKNTKNSWTAHIKKWYETHDNWGLTTEHKERTRLQLLLNELPQKKYSNVLLISWKPHQFLVKYFPQKSVTIYSFFLSKNATQITSTESLLELLKSLVTLKKKYDLILFDRILYTDVIGNIISLVQLYSLPLLTKDGILASCCLGALAPPRFPLLLIQESYLDLLENHYRLKIYTQ